MSLNLKALTPKDLGRFFALLSRPCFGGCFCAVWGHHDEQWVSRCKDVAWPNYDLTSVDVNNGREAGFLITQEGVDIGWIGAGPVAHFPSWRTRKAARLHHDEGCWVVGCFAVAPEHRRPGLTDEVLQHLLEVAKKSEATAVEATAVSPWEEARSYRGSVSLYRRNGFVSEKVEEDGLSEIHLMRHKL